MSAHIGRIFSALLVVFCLLPAQQARAELIAISGESNFVTLSPLHNGISAITLAWPIDNPTKDRVAALKAGLSSVASGGTSSRSSYEVESFLKLKGVAHNIDSVGQNLLLTVSGPSDVFPETLVHLENLLLESEYSSDWYARALESYDLVNSTITRRPVDVLDEVADFLAYEPGEAEPGSNYGEFQFGRPTQAIVRSEDPEVERRTRRLLDKLPTARAKLGLPIGEWVNALIGGGEKAYDLPKGIVHFADPDATEMLVLFVAAEQFTSEGDQLGANLLLDYIGADQGSEMFRIIRQTMRAAYDPRSDFVITGRKKALVSLSATVEASEWPRIYQEIKDIYQSVRGGQIEQEGLEIQIDSLDRAYYRDFFNDPSWGVRHYIHEFPKGVAGSFRFSLFEAFPNVTAEEIIENSGVLLPPLEEFLVILIGGGNAPPDAMRSNGYCALPKTQPLKFCLDELSNAENL